MLYEVITSNDGYVRIYDAANGEVLWETDTAIEYVSVNGDKGHGGSMGGGTAPIAYDGLLILNSGYGFAGKIVITSYSIHYTKLYESPLAWAVS